MATVKLNTGASMPLVGLGTWQSPPGEVAKAVEHALRSGYRHIDCAWIYGNEREVGQGIRASGVPRDQLFVTTKLWGTMHRHVDEALQISLDLLGLEYVDLYLVHWPLAMERRGEEKMPMNPDGTRAVDHSRKLKDTWADMEKLDKNKARAIGISNVSAPWLRELLKTAKVVPAANQIETHPLLPSNELVSLCQSHGIVVQAYSPLGSTGGPLLSHEAVQSMAQSRGVEPAQVALSWNVARSVVVLPKSVTPKRIEANLKVVELSAEERRRLDALHEGLPNGGTRYVKPKWGVDLGFGPTWDA